MTVFTDSMGNYSLSGFGAGAYTVTPSNVPQPCMPLVPNGILADDASLISRHYVVGLIALTPEPAIAADVDRLFATGVFVV